MADRFRQKYQIHNPPMAMGTTISARVTRNVEEKFGSMIQNKSTQRMNSIQTPSQTSLVMSRLNGRDSSTTNGTAKWNSTRNNPTAPQPPFSRFTYQVISSGRFPAQIMSH